MFGLKVNTFNGDIEISENISSFKDLSSFNIEKLNGNIMLADGFLEVDYYNFDMLENYNGFPKEINGNFDCIAPWESFDGFPIKITKKTFITFNQITPLLIKLFPGRLREKDIGNTEFFWRSPEDVKKTMANRLYKIIKSISNIKYVGIVFETDVYEF